MAPTLAYFAYFPTLDSLPNTILYYPSYPTLAYFAYFPTLDSLVYMYYI